MLSVRSIAAHSYQANELISVYKPHILLQTLYFGCALAAAGTSRSFCPCILFLWTCVLSHITCEAMASVPGKHTVVRATDALPVQAVYLCYQQFAMVTAPLSGSWEAFCSCLCMCFQSNKRNADLQPKVWTSNTERGSTFPTTDLFFWLGIVSSLWSRHSPWHLSLAALQAVQSHSPWFAQQNLPRKRCTAQRWCFLLSADRHNKTLPYFYTAFFSWRSDLSCDSLYSVCKCAEGSGGLRTGAEAGSSWKLNSLSDLWYFRTDLKWLGSNKLYTKLSENSRKKIH